MRREGGRQLDIANALLAGQTSECLQLEKGTHKRDYALTWQGERKEPPSPAGRNAVSPFCLQGSMTGRGLSES